MTDLAYAYAARYAVTEGRLKRYLATKVRERGWAGDGSPADKAADLTARLAEVGVVNDAVVARSTVELARRKGLAGQRVRAALAVKQVKSEVAGEAMAESEADAADPEAAALEAAERFARRKRLGRWRTRAATPESLKKEIAALMRAGHRYQVARCVIAENPDDTAR